MILKRTSPHVTPANSSLIGPVLSSLKDKLSHVKTKEVAQLGDGIISNLIAYLMDKLPHIYLMSYLTDEWRVISRWNGQVSSHLTNEFFHICRQVMSNLIDLLSHGWMASYLISDWRVILHLSGQFSQRAHSEAPIISVTVTGYLTSKKNFRLHFTFH